MLSRIQRTLTDLYDVDIEVDGEDFVCDEAEAREAVGDAVERREVLLVAEDSDGIAVGVYVAEDAVRALASSEDAWFEDAAFEGACLTTEGVSHFVYLMYRAQQGFEVSQLELELQAEVDKYATALLAGNGVGAIRQRSRALRERLFEGVEFIDDASSEEGERYRLANRLAARYALHLERTYVMRGEMGALTDALKRFYRMGSREKIAAIESAKASG